MSSTTTMLSQVLHLKEAGTTLCEIMQGSCGTDPLTRKIHQWFRGAVRMVESRGCFSQEDVIKKVEALQALLVNPMYAEDSLVQAGVDPLGRVWEIGRSDFPSYPHYLSIGGKELEVQPHVLADKIQAWIAHILPKRSIGELRENFVGEEAQYFAAYLILMERAVLDAVAVQAEEYAGDIEQFTEEMMKNFASLRKELDLLVQESEERTTAELEALGEMSDLRSQVITGQLHSEEKRHQWTQEKLGRTEEKCHSLEGDVRTLRAYCADLQQQINNLSGSSGGICSVQ